MNSKTLTLGDLDFLMLEGWLTNKQYDALLSDIGYMISRSKIETICPDYNVVDEIFKFKFYPTNIKFNVYKITNGLYKGGDSDVFTDVVEAIQHKEKLERETNNVYNIEVSYS